MSHSTGFDQTGDELSAQPGVAGCGERTGGSLAQFLPAAKSDLQGSTMVSPRLALSCLMLGCWLLFAWHVGQRGLWSAHEGRAAQNAQLMLETGNWLTPTLFTGDPDQQKPPLYYWLVAGCSALLGGEVTGLTVRLPATIAAMLGMLVIVGAGRKMWNWETGILAGVVLATTTRYAWLARVGRIDMVLSVVCMAALYCFWRDRIDSGTNGRKLSWSFYVLLGIGGLLKGPVAFLLVLLPVFAYLWLTKQALFPLVQKDWRQTWADCRLARGLTLTLVIVVPWYAYAIWTSEGIYFWRFFIYHNVVRALGTNEALKSGPIWFYLPRVLVDTFPWSLLLPGMLVTLWQQRRDFQPSGDKRAQTYLFLLLWFGVQFVFLSLVSFKRGDYLLPALPALALLYAGWMNDRLERYEQRITTRPLKNLRRRSRAILVSAFGLAALAAPLLVWGLIEFRKKGVVHSIFKIDLIDRYLNETDQFMMQQVERLLREYWLILGIGLVVIVASVWLLHTAWYNRRNWRLVASLAIPWLVCYFFYLHLLLPAIDPLREMSQFAKVIRTVATTKQTIYYFGKFDADLVFHVGQPAKTIGPWEELALLGQSPEPRFVVMKASQAQWLARNPQTAHWKVVADNRQTAFGEHRDARVLVTNRPEAIASQPKPRDSW